MSEEMNNGNRVIVGNVDAMLTQGDKAGICQRSFKLTGYLYSDDTAAEVHARVDAFQAVIDRQLLKLDIARKEDEKRQWLLSIENAKSAFNELLKRRDAGKKMSSMEKQNIDHHDTNVQTALTGIAKLDADIAELKAKVALT
jgi:hypothetical protein